MVGCDDQGQDGTPFIDAANVVHEAIATRRVDRGPWPADASCRRYGGEARPP